MISRFEYPYIPSPNFSDRGGMSIEGIVLHYTAGGKAEGSARWFQDRASRVSAHFVVGRDGEVIQCVDLDRAAWHSGNAQMTYKGQLRSAVNRFTIGIELANRGYLQKGDDGRFYYESGRGLKVYRDGPEPQKATLVFGPGHEVTGYWEPYSDLLLYSLHRLLKRLDNAGFEQVALIGHEEIALPAGRKVDPGPLFPWADFGRPVERFTSSILLSD